MQSRQQVEGWGRVVLKPVNFRALEASLFDRILWAGIYEAEKFANDVIWWKSKATKAAS